jgi:urease accessory protein
MTAAARMAPQDAVARTGWQARLELAFGHHDGRTVLQRRAHAGPLVVQKALYPEGDAMCQCIIVHPPAGIAGGDALALDIDVGPRAIAQLTTPGAAKWYRSAGVDATQAITARVAAGAALEWLPQGNIVFNAACMRNTTRIALADDAVFLGWDAYCLGRTEAHERFVHGAFRQRFEIVRNDALIWAERTAFDANSRLQTSPAGLCGAPVFGTFVAVGPDPDSDVLARCRAAAATHEVAALTQLPGVLVARYRGASLEAAHDCFRALWAIVRPALLHRAACMPRIWST